MTTPSTEGLKPDDIAAQMANVMFNLAQKAGHTLTSEDCALFNNLRKQWDATRRTEQASEAAIRKAALEEVAKLVESWPLDPRNMAIAERYAKHGWSNAVAGVLRSDVTAAIRMKKHSTMPAETLERPWISVKDRMPNDGDFIIGRDDKGRMWHEQWDSQEPIGHMVEWAYAASTIQPKE